MVIDCRMCYVYTYPKLDRQLQTILATHRKIQPGFLTQCYVFLRQPLGPTPESDKNGGIYYSLNPASVEFAEDLPVPARQTGARRQGCRRTTVLQVLANTADSVKSAFP